MALLGVGSDGHTASLFPGSDVLHEQHQWVLPVHTSATPPWRITMTLPLLNASRCVLFLAMGGDKAEAIRRVRSGEDLPATRVSPTDGELIWLIDQAAASQDAKLSNKEVHA